MSTRILVTAKNLIPIDISTLRKVTRDITFDLYIKLSDENIACVFSRTTGIDYKRLAHYIQKGVTTLYIHPDDKAAYLQFIAVPAEKVLNDPNISPEQRIATLLNMTEQNMAELFSQVNIPKDTAHVSQKLVRSYVDIMTQTPEMLSIILKLVSHGDYLYYHSIAVSIFSMLIARVSGQFNQKMVELIGLGGFLHDLGCTQLPPEAMDSPEEQGGEKTSPLQNHSALGLKMVESTPDLPQEVKWMIYQHHEQPSGGGYPNKLRGNAIYPPAKIVGIADAFSTLISQRPYRDAVTVEKAIQILKKSPNCYDRELVELLPILFISKNISAA